MPHLSTELKRLRVDIVSKSKTRFGIGEISSRNYIYHCLGQSDGGRLLRVVIMPSRLHYSVFEVTWVHKCMISVKLKYTLSFIGFIVV